MKGSGVGLGFQALLADFGVKLPLRVWTDSTASMGICQRQGLGKLRHVDTRSLWLQQKVRRGELELRKVKGTENPADLFTKHMSSPTVVEGLLRAFSCEFREGRPEGAPELRRGVGTQAGALLGLLEREHERGKLKDQQLLTASAAADELVVSKEGYVFAGTRCEELGEQLVAEAKSYNQGQLPHLMPGDLGVLFPKAAACEDNSGEDPPEDDTLEERGLRLARGGEGEEGKGKERQGSAKRNEEYFIVKKEEQVMSIIRCNERGLC